MQTGPFISLGEMKVFHVPVASACRGGGAGRGRGAAIWTPCVLSPGGPFGHRGVFSRSLIFSYLKWSSLSFFFFSLRLFFFLNILVIHKQ